MYTKYKAAAARLGPEARGQKPQGKLTSYEFVFILGVLEGGPMEHHRNPKIYYHRPDTTNNTQKH